MTSTPDLFPRRARLRAQRCRRHCESAVRHAVGAAALAALQLAAALVGPATATTDPKVLRYGEHLSQECSTCHRRDGVDNGIPSILGMKAADFIETFKFYRDGTRTNPAMVSVAQSLDDDQVQALAAYYETLPPPPPAPKKK